MLKDFIKFDNILNYCVIDFQILYNNIRLFRAEMGKILMPEIKNKIKYFY